MSELKNLKKLKSINLDDFNGVKSKIASVELTDIEEKDFGNGKVPTRQILVKSENLSDDDKKPITGSEYIPLKFEDNEWGYSENTGSKAMKFLSFFKVENFEDLVGKDVVVLKKQRESSKEFLGLNYGN